jgi:hypothetical protein
MGQILDVKMRYLFLFITLLLALAPGAMAQERNPFDYRQVIGKARYIDPINGSDSSPDGGIGAPWKTLEVSQPKFKRGDVIILAAGTHVISNYIRLPIDSAMIGAGTNRTTINNYNAGAAIIGPGLAIHLADNCYLADLKIDCKLRGTSTNATYPDWLNIYQAGYGSHYSIGSRFTNAIVERVWCLGETDVFFNRNTSPCSGSFIDCISSTKWDAVAIMDAPHKFDFYNCDFSAVGPNVIAGSTGRANCIATESLGERMRFFNCTLNANNTSSQILNVNPSSRGSSPATTGTHEFFACNATNSYTTDFGLITTGGTLNFYFTNGIKGTTGTAALGKIDNDVGSGTVNLNATNPVPNYATYEKTVALYNHPARDRARYFIDGLSYVSIPKVRKVVLAQASGSGAGSTVMGDAALTGGSGSSAVAPSATEGATRDEASATTSGNPFGTSGNANFRVGRNCFFAARVKLQQLTAERVWYGLTDLALGPASAGMGSADNIAGNYAAFRYSSGTDVNFKAITMNGATQTTVDTGIVVDTAIHLFEIICNDTPPADVTFKIDGQIVGRSISNLPTSGTALRYLVGGNTSDVAIHDLRWEFIHGECDR